MRRLGLSLLLPTGLCNMAWATQQDSFWLYLCATVQLTLWSMTVMRREVGHG